MRYEHRFCPNCATPLEWIASLEDGASKERQRCPACSWAHCNNPTPVLAGETPEQAPAGGASRGALLARRYRLCFGRQTAQPWTRAAFHGMAAARLNSESKGAESP
jgi:hypothetical protein